MNQMFKHIRIYKFSIVLYTIILLFLNSCAKDPTREAPDFGENGTLVKVTMHLRIPSFNIPEKTTKGVVSSSNGKSFSVKLADDTKETLTRSSGNTSLYNLWVFQFGPDGLTRKITKLSDVPQAIKDMVTIDTDLFTGENQTIYLVSLGKQYSSINLSGIKNITELKEYTLDFVKYEDGHVVPIIQKEEYIPYQGSYSGLNIIQIEKDGKGLIEYDPTNNFSGAIPIYAMVSKLTFDFSFDVTGLTPKLLMLNNVPATFKINNPTYKSHSFVNLEAITLQQSDFVGGKRYVASWYLPPNPQGKVTTITQEYDRYFYYSTGSTTVGTAPSNGTYINFWASDNNRLNNYALYYIFLGGNNTDDFNIYAHNNYNLLSDINSSDSQNDKRIFFKELNQTVDMVSSYVEYISNRINIKQQGYYNQDYDLDCHSSMRPIEICALRGIVKIGVFSDVAGTIPVSEADSWLKISAYPNYTEALNRYKSGDSKGLVASLTQDVSIPKIFNFYLYCDEYEKYSKENPYLSGEKRTLYLRVDFEASATVKDYVIYRLSQRQGLYIGRFGGEFNTQTGEYEKGLVYETVKEFGNYYSYLSYEKAMYEIPTGAYNENLDVLYREYDVGNFYNGKNATVLSATNKNGSTFKYNTGDNAKMELPRYINGKLDLYQYSTSKLNYFVARYCFDKNRDLDGDGYIKGDEIVWYLPAYFQVVSIPFNMYGDRNTSLTNTAFAKGLVSTNMYSSSSTAIIQQYTFSIYSSSANNTTTPRCVRDVALPADESYPGGFKAYAEDGYAVIDAMGMSPSVREDRVASPITRADGRVNRSRNLQGSSISNKGLSSVVSARFRVAPYDINAQGKERNYIYVSDGQMTWAAASGYNITGNSFVFTDPIEAADTGCPMYGGKDGTEVGKWRLPTNSEVVLMDMMNETLMSTSAITGYKSLTNPEDITTKIKYAYYWTSTEYYNSSKPLDPISSASTLNRSFSISNGVVLSKNRGYTDYNTGKSSAYFVRCIQDLPAK